MDSFKAGQLVKFSWWSSYKAPSAIKDSVGHSEWYEIFPEDSGIVIQSQQNNQLDLDFIVVLFSRINKILKIHSSMLSIVD